ncbi:6-methylsalicylic acid decarboxylase atA [Lasiodiplodia hormozganensis]|uniref:6-methylsalicylic acid decarboxylase atA n=1 Tax=Lasiodiplodia hormozganensis TaxID=869390 RepID=A0AA39Y7G1_9PEZI|nr:6-methylsalicylic acid decarboxylase atA [Lasiodiplodia hormozganensis]
MIASTPTFDIAIVGGGIAGLSLAIGLLRFNIPVTIYESAHAFHEIGVGLGIAPNAKRAIQLLSPELAEEVGKLSTFNAWESKRSFVYDVRCGMAIGGSATTPTSSDIPLLVCPVPSPTGLAAVHRARLLDVLIKLIPEGTAKFGKRLRGITTLPDSKLRLEFQDGSDAIHDAVIGCDGIKSRTRGIVLGEDHPATQPRFTGKYVYRGLLPMDQAVELVGDEFARNSQLYLGYHAHLITYPIEKGTMVNVAGVAGKDSWDSPSWDLPDFKNQLRADFEKFSPHVQRILHGTEMSAAHALFEHPPAPRYSRDRICLVGDAAHATPPHQGAGAAMAVEDAYVLSNILAEVKSVDEIQPAFEAYEKVRMERTHKLVASSKEAGRLWDLEMEGIEDDLEKLRNHVQHRFDWIWNVDLTQQVTQAREIFHNSVGI